MAGDARIFRLNAGTERADDAESTEELNFIIKIFGKTNAAIRDALERAALETGYIKAGKTAIFIAAKNREMAVNAAPDLKPANKRETADLKILNRIEANFLGFSSLNFVSGYSIYIEIEMNADAEASAGYARSIANAAI